MFFPKNNWPITIFIVIILAVKSIYVESLKTNNAGLEIDEKTTAFSNWGYG
jgi:hypothetical protein